VKPVRLLLLLLVLGAALAAMPGSAYAKTSCGSFTAKNGSFSLKVHVYRIKGHVSCRKARSLSHHVIGARCQGEKVVGAYRCYHGAPALREPAASGYTLRKRGTVIEGRIRSA
jgi:hypothetical protein